MHGVEDVLQPVTVEHIDVQLATERLLQPDLKARAVWRYALRVLLSSRALPGDPPRHLAGPIEFSAVSTSLPGIES